MLGFFLTQQEIIPHCAYIEVIVCIIYICLKNKNISSSQVSLAAISFKVEVDNLNCAGSGAEGTRKSEKLSQTVWPSAAAQQLASGLLVQLRRCPSDQQEEAGSRTSAYDMHGGK